MKRLLAIALLAVAACSSASPAATAPQPTSRPLTPSEVEACDTFAAYVTARDALQKASAAYAANDQTEVLTRAQIAVNQAGSASYLAEAYPSLSSSVIGASLAIASWAQDVQFGQPRAQMSFAAATEAVSELLADYAQLSQSGVLICPG